MTLLLAAELGGCARNGPPAPVEVRGQQRYDRSAAPERATQSEPSAAVIQSGDTLYSIARRHNTPVRAIIDANRLDPPYVLQPGQRLTLPRVRTHVVRAGDTMHGISRRYGVEMSALVRANAIEPPYHVQVGQALILPGAAAAPAPVVQTAAVESAPSVSAAPVAPVTRGAIESGPLPPAGPGAAAPNTVSSAPSAPPPSERPAQVAAAEAPRTIAEPPTRGSTPAPTPAPAEPGSPLTGLPEARTEAIEPAGAGLPARAGRVFQWPVRGRIISDFGPKGGGLHNDGINIAAAKGAPIRAAENGVVVYAGNELRGFGNLLLLRHADGWMTAYAHADEILVARGDQVRRGQTIARVGETGNVSAPQVHFEIRRGSRAVNPHDFLAANTASSN